MEVSSAPTITKRFWISSSPPGCASESLLLTKRQHLKCYGSSLSVSPIRFTVSKSPVLRIGVKNHHFKVLSSRKEETPVLEARSIDEIYDALAARIIPTAAMESNLNLKYIIGLAGPPGAGKSTIASEVARRINLQWPQKAQAVDSLGPPDFAIVLPMDGFHLYRHQLDAMEGSVYAPSFNHGVGDPVEDDIFVNLEHKLVIVEGNYLLLEEGPWKEVSAVFDEKWFVEVDTDTAMQRVLKRHISTGKPPDVAKWRIEYNDRPNAELINVSKKNADLIIRPVMRSLWTTESSLPVPSVPGKRLTGVPRCTISTGLD